MAPDPVSRTPSELSSLSDDVAKAPLDPSKDDVQIATNLARDPEKHIRQVPEEQVVSQPVQQLDPALYLEVLDARVSSDSKYFDLNLEYTKAEENALVWKLDRRLFTTVLLSTFILNIVRSCRATARPHTC